MQKKQKNILGKQKTKNQKSTIKQKARNLLEKKNQSDTMPERREGIL